MLTFDGNRAADLGGDDKCIDGGGGEGIQLGEGVHFNRLVCVEVYVGETVEFFVGGRPLSSPVSLNITLGL
jgi:hypothetical protein